MLEKGFELLRVAALVLAFVSVTILASKSSRLRRLLLYALLFLSFSRLYINAFMPSLAALRMPIALILLLAFGNRTLDVLLGILKSGRLVPVAAWTAYVCLSNLLVSSQPDPRLAYEQFGSLLFMLIMLCFFLYSSERETRTILVFIAVSALVNTLFGLDRYIPFMQRFRLSEGVRTTHQVIGQSALHGMIFLLCALPCYRAARHRIAVFGGMLVSAVGIALSGARSPTIAYAAVMLLWKRSVKWWVGVAVLVFIVMVISQSSFVESSFTQERYSRLFEAIQQGRPTSVSEVGFRAENVELALQIFMSSPVFGTGVGSWISIRSQAEGQIGFTLAAHNGWALMAAEMGLVGYLLFAWMIWSSLRGTRFAFDGRLASRVGFAGALGLLSIGIMSFGGDQFINRQIYLYLALTIASGTLSEREAERPVPVSGEQADASSLPDRDGV